MKSKGLSILFLFLAVNGQAYAKNCAEQLAGAGIIFHQVCTSETNLKTYPDAIYSCYVEFNLPNRWLKTALHLNADVDAVCSTETALNRAAQIRPDVVPLLLSRGANPESLDSDCKSPVVWAAQTGHLSALQALHRAGASLNRQTGLRKDKSGRCIGQSERPLTAAASWGQDKVVEFLLEKGADIEATGFWGQTALMNAVDKTGCADCGSFAKTVDILLNKGANVHAVSTGGDNITKGQTALFFAAFRGTLDSVKKLVNAGADVNHKNASGISIIEGANQSMYSRKDKISFLCSQGAVSNLCMN